MHPERDTSTESILEALGARERAMPDADFEARIAAAARRGASAPRRARGRRRLLFVPAAFTGIAAVLAVAIVLLPGSGTPPSSIEGFDDSGSASFAEMSFSMFDDTFGLDSAIADSSRDALTMDPSSLDDWFGEGDSL